MKEETAKRPLPPAGRTRRDVACCPRLFERGIQRRDIDLHAESAWRGRAGNGQHDPALRRYRQQRARTQGPLPSADLRLVTCASVRSRRRRLGSDPIVRGRRRAVWISKYNGDKLIKELGSQGFFDDLPESVRSGFMDQVLKALPFLRNKLGGHG